jgi:hypothetical protein
MWALCGVWKGGLEEVLGDFYEKDYLKLCVGREENGKMSIYFVYYFNGRWLKDSSLLCFIFYSTKKCGR